jgi:hypothetical protein
MFPGHMMIIIVNTFIQDIYKYVPKKKNVFLGYIMLQLFCGYSMCYFP